LAFTSPRVILSVNGQHIHSDEVNELVSYYQTYRTESNASLIRRAIATIIPQKVMLAELALEAKQLAQQVQQIANLIADGGDFGEVAQQYSQDSEAPTADGRYTFARENTVYPFDIYSFTTQAKAVSIPFPTKYGYHILQPLKFIAGETPADLQVEVRHILLMFPTMIALEEKDEDVRKYINDKVQQAEILIYEIGLQNVVAFDLRDQLTIQSQAAPSAPAVD
jgi:parvulin-like peptidyl-prolyl isomerase